MDGRDLLFAGIARQAELVRSGEISARELTAASLARIERFDDRLNAFRVVFHEAALAEADAADARVAAGEVTLLLGVPVAIKDDTDVAGEVTARGTNAYGAPAGADAEVVRRLRAAGAVVVGKTNVPELMAMPFTETPTWGATRNPWDLQRTPGGSSGGSAAAVAAGLVGAALASDGAGSIRIPAACCGLFGLKPQRGRVPTAPHAELWHGLSTYGPITRSVEDTALFYDAVKDGGRAGGLSFTDAAGRDPGRLRIAVSTKVPRGVVARVDPAQRRAVEDTAALLESLGHEVVERDPDYGNAFQGVVGRYLRGIHDEAARMPHPERLARRTRGFARMGGAIRPGLLARARSVEATDRARLEGVFADADVVLTPMFTRAPLRIGEYEGRGAQWTLNGALRFVPFCGAWNHTGQPAMSVPAGMGADGLPVAAQVLGPTDSEPLLLALAAQLEAARPWADRRPPVS